MAIPQPLGQDRKREAFHAVVRVEELARQLAIARVERATDVEIAVRGGRFAQPGGLAEGCVVAEQIRVQGRLGPRGRRQGPRLLPVSERRGEKSLLAPRIATRSFQERGQPVGHVVGRGRTYRL